MNTPSNWRKNVNHASFLKKYHKDLPNRKSYGKTVNFHFFKQAKIANYTKVFLPAG